MAPATRTASTRLSRTCARLWLSLALAAAVVAGVVAVLMTDHHRRGGPQPAPSPTGSPSASPSPHIAVPLVTAAQLAALPEATTWANLVDAPTNTDRSTTDGAVVHNTEPIPVFTAPGGTAFARLPTTQAGGPTWLPVIDRQPGWAQVLLPSKPNGATGWLADTGLQLARTPYQIRVDLVARSLRLLRDGQQIGNWSVGVGAAATPTPAGRTFLLASITDPAQSWSPVILPLGVHSTALDTFGGGPGTVALHTWPTADVYGTPSSHGCIRVPPDAMRELVTVPLGTPVLITDQHTQTRGRTYPQ